jgi:hypothetical protein
MRELDLLPKWRPTRVHKKSRTQFWLSDSSGIIYHLCRYFFKLNCFKLIGWFNHHKVFPPIRSVCCRFLHCDYRKLHCDYRKLHCDYRKLHCDYRKLHCCLGLTALKSTNHSRAISLCILSGHVNKKRWTRAGHAETLWRLKYLELPIFKKCIINGLCKRR